ncbi:MAG: hypothetical protein D3925_18095 [Candidatus Electrothrix sp. AR5]|nr:hypothetical protein [Candidatus Electrothrix sp. AR5]
MHRLHLINIRRPPFFLSIFVKKRLKNRYKIIQAACLRIYLNRLRMSTGERIKQFDFLRPFSIRLPRPSFLSLLR